MIKVYTKYDSIPNRIIMNVETGDLDDIWKKKVFDAYKIEQGLEGVRFVHFRDYNEKE